MSFPDSINDLVLEGVIYLSLNLLAGFTNNSTMYFLFPLFKKKNLHLITRTYFVLIM